MSQFFRRFGILLLVIFAAITVNSVNFKSPPDLLLDLTTEKTFTLTDGTRKILDDLVTPINLILFYSPGSVGESGETRNFARVVKETLAAYQRLAPSRIILHTINPKNSKKDAARAKELGLQSVQFSRNGAPEYLGLVGINSNGDVNFIPILHEFELSSLEYRVSLLVKQLAYKERPRLGVLSGLPIFGGYDSKSGLELKPWLMFDELNERYEVEHLPIDCDEIPSGLKVLMVVHPKKLSMNTLFAIDRFVMGGGKLLAFVDPYSEQDMGDTYFGVGSTDRSSNLDVLFEAWGLEMLSNRVVGDGLYAMEASRDPRIKSVRLPTALGLPRYALSRTDISIAGLEAINMTTAGELIGKNGATTRFTPLIQSSKYTSLFDTQRFTKLVAPEEMMREIPFKGGTRHVMAARVEGPVKSAFPEGFEAHPPSANTSMDINVVVVADTDLLTDRMWVKVSDDRNDKALIPWSDNERFVSNVLDDLFDASELIGARSRGSLRLAFERVESIQRRVPVLLERQAALRRQLQTLDKLESPPPTDSTKLARSKAQMTTELKEIDETLKDNAQVLGTKMKLLNIVLIPITSLLIFFTCKWVVTCSLMAYRKPSVSRIKKS